jgi:hypothetical protein
MHLRMKQLEVTIEKMPLCSCVDFILLKTSMHLIQEARQSEFLRLAFNHLESLCMDQMVKIFLKSRAGGEMVELEVAHRVQGAMQERVVVEQRHYQLKGSSRRSGVNMEYSLGRQTLEFLLTISICICTISKAIHYIFYFVK